MPKQLPQIIVNLPTHKAGVVISIPLPLLIDYMDLYHLQPTLGNPAPAFKPDLILIVKRKTNDLKPAQHHMESAQDSR